jgi:hypothetical protein
VIESPEAPGFKGPDGMYVTEVEYGRMEVIDVGVDGFPLYG